MLRLPSASPARRLLRPVVVGSCIAVALWCGVASGAASEPAADEPKATVESLGDERAATTNAEIVEQAPIRSEPRPDAAKVDRLHFQTENGYPEVYVALRRRVDPWLGEWIEVRIPGRPNGRTGWVPRDALGALRTSRRSLRIDRRASRATLFVNGRARWTFPVGTGRASTPTPAGHFWVREKFPVGNPGGAFGPFAFGTSAYSTLSEWPKGGVVGIHGTDEPRLVPGHPSHGCVRLRNRDVRRLYRALPVGSAVEIV